MKDDSSSSNAFKRRRTEADDDALYASILKRAYVAELQPACSALLEEQLVSTQDAVQSVATAMQRLHEVKTAVEKLKSAQPKHRSGSSNVSVSMELLASAEAMQKQLWLQLGRFGQLDKSQQYRYPSSIIDLLSSGSEDERDDDYEEDEDDGDSNVKRDFRQEGDPNDSSKSAQPKNQYSMAALKGYLEKCTAMVKDCPRTSVINTEVIRTLRYLECIGAEKFTEDENAASTTRSMKKCLDATVERILNEPSSTPDEIRNALSNLMVEMWLVAQACPHVEAALSRRCERIQAIDSVGGKSITVASVEETRKQWTEFAKKCHSTAKEMLASDSSETLPDRETWEVVRKMVQGMFKRIIYAPLAASTFLKFKHLKRIESAVEIVVQWVVDNPAPRERRDTRSEFLRQLKFVMSRCTNTCPYLSKSEAALKKCLVEETRCGECDLDMLRDSLRGTAEDLRSLRSVPIKRFHKVLRLLKFAAVRNRSPEWDPKSVPELKECVLILKANIGVVRNPHFWKIAEDELGQCMKALEK